MGKKAPFGRPVPRDPLRLWWEAKRRSRAFWGNALLILAVGGGGGVLIAAVTSRDGSRTDNRAIATRPRQTVPGVVLSASTSTPSPLAAPSSSTTTSTGTGSALSVPPAGRSRAGWSRGAGTAASVAPGTTVPEPGVVYTVIQPARGSPATTFRAGPTPTQSTSTTAAPPTSTTSTTSTSTTTTAPSPLVGGLPGLLR